MKKIDRAEEMRKIPKSNFILITKLAFPDHVQKDDRIHRATCSKLSGISSRPVLPTKKSYYHVKSTDVETLKKYQDKTCKFCRNV